MLLTSHRTKLKRNKQLQMKHNNITCEEVATFRSEFLKKEKKNNITN